MLLLYKSNTPVSVLEFGKYINQINIPSRFLDECLCSALSDSKNPLIVFMMKFFSDEKKLRLLLSFI